VVGDAATWREAGRAEEASPTGTEDAGRDKV
jgi:hypothetical protein